MRHLLIGLAVVASLAVGGCDQKPDKEKKSESVSITSSGSKITLQSEDGKAKIEISGKGEASAKLPGFLSLYPGGKIQSSMTGIGEDSSGGSIMFTTSTSPGDVIGFYRKAAKAADMDETMNAETSGTLIFVATNKKTGESFHVSAMPSDGGTQASLFWSNGG